MLTVCAGRASPADAGASQQPAQRHSQQPQQQQQQQYQYQDAAVRSDFPVLQGMSAEELHLLLVDERTYR